MEDPSSCKSAILKKQNATKSLTADFKETIYSSMFNTPQKATGQLNYKQADKIRWEHTSPTKKVMLMDGAKIKYSENGKEIKDPSTKAVVKKIQNIMMKMLSGDFLDGKDFHIYYYESGSEYKLKLKPKSSRMSKYIESVVLIFNKSDLLLNEMSLIEDEYEKIVYSFSNVKSNSSINDSKFQSF
jgi:outer membrane lipoprotein carrier protein